MTPTSRRCDEIGLPVEGLNSIYFGDGIYFYAIFSCYTSLKLLRLAIDMRESQLDGDNIIVVTISSSCFMGSSNISDP